MVGDSTRTITQRYYNQLYNTLKANLPRPGTDQHRYSTGATILGLRHWHDASRDTYNIEISAGIDYGKAELGYKTDGSRRQSRGWREAFNFQIVDRAIARTSKIVAGFEGSVIKK